MADMADNQTQDEWDEETVYGPFTAIVALNQTEGLVEFSRVVPLSASIMVNKAKILDLLDQARKALPEDLAAADTVIADADAVLGRADSTAEARIAEANSCTSSILDRTNEHATQILADAEKEAERTRSRVNGEAIALVLQVRSDAEVTTADANARAAHIISIENIVHMAGDRVREIVSEARRLAASLREGVDNCVASSLNEPAHLIFDLVRRTDAGRRTIAERCSVNVTDVDPTNE